MKIKKIALHNIKSFAEETEVEFGEAKVNAFSGINGAGKSTLLKMIWLVQKAHYVLQTPNGAQDELLAELSRFLVKRNSYFSLFVDFKEQILELTLCRSNDSSKIELKYSDIDTANAMWNIAMPENLILFVDASKEFSEETLAFDEIDIAGNDRALLLMTAIVSPGKLFSGIYRQLVKDWAHARLIPSKPSRLFYYQVAARLFNLLIPKVVLSNFSGSHKPKEFVLLGKSLQANATPLYDVREFSSGEKALLSTLTFLCMSKSVSAFLIDEPENHFHESLLLKFVSLLNEMCQTNGFVTLVQKIPDPKRPRGTKPKEGIADDEADLGRRLDAKHLQDSYGGTALSQVFLSTHSKSLIYSVFTLGQNFLVDRSVQRLEYNNAESKLRQIGLSTTFSKVLLVEGTGDNDALESLFATDNIKVKSMDGSSAVVDTFKRVATLANHISESRFVFLVDSDNKPEEYFIDLRNINPSFYNKTFISLPVHELENLFLDASIFAKILASYADLVGGETEKMSMEYIKEVIEQGARASLPTVYKKEISLQFMHSVERHFADLIWGHKKFSWDDAISVEERVKSGLSVDANHSLNAVLLAKSTEVFERYQGISYDELVARCDGKQALGVICQRLGQESKMGGTQLKKALYKYARESPESAIGKLVSDIRSRLS